MTPLLLLSFPMALAAAPSRFDSSAWPHRAAVSTSIEPGPGAYASVRLDAGAYRHGGPSLAALRVASPGGTETPFLIRDASPPANLVELAARIVNRVRTPQGGLQFVLMFEKAGQVHNTLRFEWSASNFKRPIRLESSADQSRWDLVKEATLLDFRQDGLTFRTIELTYPDSTRPYLRVTIDNWTDPPESITGASWRSLAAPPLYTDLGQFSVRDAPAEPGEGKGDSAFLLYLPFPMPAPLRIELEPAEGEFVRTAEIQTRTQSRPWSTICSGTIASVAGERQTRIECPAPLSDEVRLVVRNRDNPPVRTSSVRLSTPARTLLFPVRETGEFALYAGDNSARLPSYDLPEILSRTGSAATAPATLGVWTSNLSYRPPPAPLSEQFRGAVAPILVAVVLVIGAAALLLLRKTD